MTKEHYIILIVTLKGLSLATRTSFDYDYEAKEWINKNGVDGTSYIIQKTYSK